MSTRRIKVLLVTSRKLLKPDTKIIGEPPSAPLGDSEVEDFVELLSAANIPFHITYSEKLRFEDIVADGRINYSTIILALPETELATNTITMLKQVSSKYGVSVMASYDGVGERSKAMFGIANLKNNKFCCPCSIVVDKNKLADPHIEPEIKLGDGWKISFQKWGLKRFPGRYVKKHFKQFKQQVFSYKSVELLADVEPIATVKGQPAIVKYQYGKATNYYIALQSDTYLDRFNSMHRIIREFIRQNSGWGLVECNLAGTMVLRMDDPGTCERVYLKGYDTEIMDRQAWQTLIGLLKKHQARLSVMYIPLWVDDANPHNGRLFINGQEIKDRQAGAIYHSKDVCFVKENGHPEPRVYDYAAEFLALKEYIHTGLIDIESHGLTHIDTNLEGWLAADDRYSNLNWYHEFRHVPENKDTAAGEQIRILRDSAKKIEAIFEKLPAAVTPSGHEQSQDSEQIAHTVGYRLFSSEYNTFQKNDHIIRNDKIRSVFLDATAPTPSIFHSGYPIVGVFHDYELAQEGVNWLNTVIEAWKEQGITRFISLRELTGYLCASVDAYQEANTFNIEVDISHTGDIKDNSTSRHFSEHQMTLDVTLPFERKPVSITVDGRPYPIPDYHSATHQLQLTLPPFKALDKRKIAIKLNALSSVSH
ncbi:MAG: hypothetical protein KDI79_12860 [Anaerolineae bacterium]|nr:hypothetical protein [Anaerolineae bacterium]